MGGQGMKIKADSVDINDCVIRNCNQDSTIGGDDGIGLAGQYLLVVGCRAVDTQGTATQDTGITATPNAVDCKISDCVTRGNVTTGIDPTAGTRITVSNNVVW
jgi:hypothetical protein